jgi:hypothetical protein
MRAFLAVVLTGVLAVAASPALAGTTTSPGVHVDPGSPAGKQYQIPITSARGETAGQSPNSSSGSTPTFGSGVTPSSSGASSTPTATTASPSGRASAAHRRAAGRPGHASTHGKNGATSAVTVTTQANRQATTQSNQVGSGSWLPLAAGGALVLLLGCGGGLALKRRM